MNSKLPISLVVLAVAGSLWLARPSEARSAWMDWGTHIIASGESVLVDAKATISLPAEFESAAKGTKRVVLLTSKDGCSNLCSSAVSSGSFTVSTDEMGTPSQAFFWAVIAEKN